LESRKYFSLRRQAEGPIINPQVFRTAEQEDFKSEDRVILALFLFL
jgi:hypothetical protein